MKKPLSRYLAAAALSLPTHAALAQTEPYRFDLKAEKLTVPAGPWQVARVLDLRPDRSRLGMVRQGLNNARTSANFSQPLATELLALVQAQLPARPTARPVLMRVFTLAISEELRATSEHAEAELIADFLEQQPDSSYRVVSLAGETTRRGGLDVTKHHAADVALVLQQALSKLAAQPAATAETLSRADALAGRGGAEARRFAMPAVAVPKAGFYRTFEEFRDNAPGEADAPFTVVHVPHEGKRWAGSDEIQANYLYLDAQHPARPVGTSKLWGLSDGKEAFIAYQHRFYKLLLSADSRSYTFVGPPVYDAEAATNMAVGAALGGVVGAAIAGAANGAGTMDTYEVHLATGRIVPTEEDKPADKQGFAANDTAAVYVYRRFNTGKEPPLTIQASGQPDVTLPPRRYLALTWRDRRQELKLCAQQGTAPAICREFVPDFSQPTYLECSLPASGGPPVLRPVPAREALFEMKRIRLLNK